MRVEIDVHGDKQVVRELLRLGDRGHDVRPAFEAIVDDLVNWTDSQFQTQGLRGSGGWAPLKPRTLARKAALGLDPRILHATLALRNSLTHRGDPHMIEEITADSLRWGSDLPYARAHQKGYPPNNLPQRRPVELTETDRRSVVKTIQRYVMTGSAT